MLPFPALSFVYRYEVELYKRIEELINKQLPLYATVEEEVMQLVERVGEAQRFTKLVSLHSLVTDEAVKSS